MGSKSHLPRLKRQAERVTLNASVRLVPNDWSSLEVRIVNVSRTGFRAQCDARLSVGGCVSVDIPGIGWVAAQVEWQDDGSIGAKFLQPISLARCQWAPKRGLGVLTELWIERARQSTHRCLHPAIAAEGRRNAG